MLGAVAEESVTLEAAKADKAPTVSFDSLVFDYDPDYVYVVVVDYDRTEVETPVVPDRPGTGDDGMDGKEPGGNVTIPDGNVPLGDTIILDEMVPLGALPTTGSQSAVAAAFGAMTITLGVLLKKRKK